MKAIRINGVCEKVSLSRATIYRYIREGSFPKPFRLSQVHRAWLESDIDDWLAARVAESRDASNQPVAELSA